MGGCCYTPRKTDFVWWYWLVLTLVFCIPMTVAAWVMQKGYEPSKGEEDSEHAGSDLTEARAGLAFKVFLTAFVVTVIMLLFASLLIVRQPALATFGLGFGAGLFFTCAASATLREARGWFSRLWRFLTWLGLWFLLWWIGMRTFSYSKDTLKFP